MRWCEKYKINVEEEFNCVHCEDSLSIQFPYSTNYVCGYDMLNSTNQGEIGNA